MKIEHQTVTRIQRFKIWGMALIVGLIAGLIAVLFTEFVSMGSKFIASMINRFSISVILLPAIVYSVHYITNHYFLIGDSYFGVQALEYELAEIDRLVMNPRKVALKIFNTSIALIGGFAVGQFGPMLYLGGAIGSNIGYYFKLHKETIRILIGCSVAAAISATFQMPLFAAVFAIEVIYAKRYFDYMLPLLISSLTAYVLAHYFFSETHFFNMNALLPLDALSQHNWIFIVLLAIGLGVLSGVYVIALKYAADKFKNMPLKRQNSIMPIVIALMGLLYFIVPHVHYFDLDALLKLLVIKQSALILTMILGIRLLLTTVQLGSGIYGGNFSPGLSAGILLGLIFFVAMPSAITQNIDILLVVTFSVVGMLSGFAHAPVSAVILALESSGQVSILFPALVIAMISHLVSDLIAEESVFNLK